MRRIVVGLLGLLACSVVTWSGSEAWSAVLAERRSQAVQAQVEGDPAGVVDFTQIGPSDWDRVYFFHPYTTPEYIHQSLGFQWPDADRSRIATGKGVNLVVFVRGERVVGWFDHPRNRGDLIELATAGFTRDQAKFRVVRDQEGRAVLVR
jgi:hypothetical protein